MLNTREPFVLNLTKRGGGETRRIVARWPSDEEWIKRQSARTAPIKMLQAGTLEMANEDMDQADRVDMELFRKIHVDGEYTEDDALYFVDLLSSGAVVRDEEGVEDFTVELAIFGVKGIPALRTRHVMQEPSYRLQRRWRATNSTTRVKGHRYQTIVDLRLSAELYGALVQSCEGYDGQVPILHKHAVVQEVFRRLAALESADAAGAEDVDPAGF